MIALAYAVALAALAGVLYVRWPRRRERKAGSPLAEATRAGAGEAGPMSNTVPEE